MAYTNLLLLMAIFAVCSCGSEESNSLCEAPYTAVGVEATHLTSPCNIWIEPHPRLTANHFDPYDDSDAAPVWNSNPPSIGSHFYTWAAYGEYQEPVDRRYYVHNLEHGAVVFLYKCEEAAGCPEVVEALREVEASIPDDPLCTGEGEGVRARTLITPDPLIDVPIAAAAWGWTYRAECMDKESLMQFAREHYNHGTECTCVDGISFFPTDEEF